MSINLRWLTKFALLGAIFFGALQWWQTRPISHGPGTTAPDLPRQTTLTKQPAFVYRDFTITPLAGYQIEARVLSRASYHFDSGAALAPLDLALGWGPMSDETVLDHLDISQSARWYTWYAKGALPIARRDIERHSANVHIVPASRSVEKQLAGVRVGHVVRLRGQLIKAEQPGYSPWVSSLSREDTGDGGCELMWVERVTLL